MSDPNDKAIAAAWRAFTDVPDMQKLLGYGEMRRAIAAFLRTKQLGPRYTPRMSATTVLRKLADELEGKP